MAKKPQHAQNNQRSQQGKQGQQQKRGGKAQATVARTKHSQATPARPWRPGRDKFLPVSRADMDARGWDQCDFVYICGDAYVDHPSFGMAIISRVLDAHGYKVGIICQPDWTDPASITVLGEPRLGFLVSAGNMDSMVNHYSVTKHRRHTDAYTPGGEEGRRPNRAVTVYGNLIRQTFKDVPIIIGGIEASLRRLAHYDYWQDKLKRSVLLDSGADILIYGMGEHAIVEIADALDAAALARFQTYYTLLDERSKVMNLTAIHGETDVAQLHFLDSAALLTVEPLAGKSVIDVGTGAGFPGLPLKIAQPDISLTLLDSLDKRVRFLGDVCAATGLTDVTCLHARAEEAPELRGRFDAAVSRAVARLYLLSTTIVLVLIDAVSVWLGAAAMKLAWREIMFSYSGWFAFHMEPAGYVKMFVFVLLGYAIVTIFDFRRIRKIPMDEALKSAE